MVEAKSAEAFTLKLVGLPALIAQMDQDTQKNIGAITMAALLVMSIVLLTLFRFGRLSLDLFGRHHWVDLVVRVHGMDRGHDELRECYYSGVSNHCGARRCNPPTV